MGCCVGGGGQRKREGVSPRARAANGFGVRTDQPTGKLEGDDSDVVTYRGGGERTCGECVEV